MLLSRLTHGVAVVVLLCVPYTSKSCDGCIWTTAQYAVADSVKVPLRSEKPSGDTTCAVHCDAQPDDVPIRQVSTCAVMGVPANPEARTKTTYEVDPVARQDMPPWRHTSLPEASTTPSIAPAPSVAAGVRAENHSLSVVAAVTRRQRLSRAEVNE
ncbi:UNVERIFIED_CONTAM: hypothetical protein RKD50_000183 [Streptomyces canus]